MEQRNHQGVLKYSDRKKITRRPGIEVLTDTLFHGNEARVQAILQEYRAIQRERNDDAIIDDAATAPVNVVKNRYPDVLPLRETAVKLTPSGVNGSDYINANFVSDMTSDDRPTQSYICCQAPLVHTFPDFWQIDAPIIVMITNLVERNRIKADTYWPTHLGQVLPYGSIRVKLVREYTRGSNVVIRSFHIWKVAEETAISSLPTPRDGGSGSDPDGFASDGEWGSYHSDDQFSFSSSESESELEPIDGQEVRKVTQLHCTRWPDFGVPETTDIMKDLIYELELRKRNLSDPIVVHCSAGIGRTGTFVAIHMALQRDLHGTEITIRDSVRHLRSQRLGMVQSKEQYMFVYAVVAEMLRDRENIGNRQNRPTQIPTSYRRASDIGCIPWTLSQQEQVSTSPPARCFRNRPRRSAVSQEDVILERLISNSSQSGAQHSTSSVSLTSKHRPPRHLSSSDFSSGALTISGEVSIPDWPKPQPPVLRDDSDRPWHRVRVRSVPIALDSHRPRSKSDETKYSTEASSEVVRIHGMKHGRKDNSSGSSTHMYSSDTTNFIFNTSRVHSSAAFHSHTQQSSYPIYSFPSTPPKATTFSAGANPPSSELASYPPSLNGQLSATRPILRSSSPLTSFTTYYFPKDSESNPMTYNVSLPMSAPIPLPSTRPARAIANATPFGFDHGLEESQSQYLSSSPTMSSSPTTIPFTPSPSTSPLSKSPLYAPISIRTPASVSPFGSNHRSLALDTNSTATSLNLHSMPNHSTRPLNELSLSTASINSSVSNTSALTSSSDASSPRRISQVAKRALDPGPMDTQHPHASALTSSQ